MQKKYVAAGLAAAVLAAGVIGLGVEYQRLHRSRQEIQQLSEQLELEAGESGSLQEQLESLQEQLANLQENENSLRQRAHTLALVEDGFAERIRDTLSGDDMMVLGVFPVGEDTKESVKRFLYCHDFYGEYYLVDYVTGEILDLGYRTPSVRIIRRGKDANGNYRTVVGDWEVLLDDYDGNGEEDILLVTPSSFTNAGYFASSGICLWLQRNGEFVPVNRHFCGSYTEWGESEFSVKIGELEEKFRKEQNPEDWSADKIGAWIREELFAGKENELEAELTNPKSKIPYTQWREPLDLHVTLRQDSREQYSVRIPENPYGERQINAWFQEFYKEQEEQEREFMGVGIEENGVVYSEEERKGVFTYNYAVWPERVDDTVICFTYVIETYSGGAHGNNFMGTVVFDTQSGKVLQLEDVAREYDDFCAVVLNYIRDNYEAYGWGGYETVRDVLTGKEGGGWCFTDYGFRVALVGGNGLGMYEYEVPYEVLLDDLKEEYLPVTRAAEYDMYMEEKVRMDVNGDGLLDLVKGPVIEDGSIRLSVNDTVTELDLQWGEQPLAEANVRTRSVLLRRQEDGLTRLIWKIYVYEEQYTRTDHIYVYRIEDETFVLEEDYDVTED